MLDAMEWDDENNTKENNFEINSENLRVNLQHFLVVGMKWLAYLDRRRVHLKNWIS